MRKKIDITGSLIKPINFCYEQVFRQKIGDEAKSFIKNLSYLFAGTFIATVAGFALNIIAGRILGPVEYGKVALVQSVTMFLSIPMLLGFSNAMVKYASEKKDFKERSVIISTALALVFILITASFIFCFFFSLLLANLFSTTNELFHLSLLCAVLYTFYTMTTNMLKGLFKIKTYAIFQPVYAVIVLLAFLFLVFARNLLSFKSIVYPTFLGYGVVSIVLSVFFLRKYFRLSLDKTWAKTLTGYSMFAAIGGLSFVFYTNIDKILINKYLTVADVGIYRAYFVASVNITVLLWAMFNTIFFPTVSKYKDKGMVFNRINKLIPYLLGLGFPLMFFCEFIILKLYGKQYPMDLILMLMFAFAAILVVWYGLYDWTFASEGIRGTKLSLLGTVTIAILNAFLNIYLIPRFALYGAIGAHTISFAAGICCLYALKKEIV